MMRTGNYKVNTMKKSIIKMIAVLVVLGFGWGAALHAQQGDTQDPRVLVNKCIAALGGEVAVKNLMNFKGEGDMKRYYGGSREFPGTLTLLRLGEKYWRSTTMKFGETDYTSLYIYNGKRAWTQRNGIPTSQPVLSFKSDLDHTPLLLLEKEAQLRLGDSIEIGGKPAWMVEADFKGKKTAFYIDQADFMLLEIRFKDLYFNRDEVKATQEKRIRFSDYRKTGDVMFPFKMTFTKDGKKTMTVNFKKVEFNPAATPEMFFRPSKKPDLRYREERLH